MAAAFRPLDLSGTIYSQWPDKNVPSLLAVEEFGFPQKAIE